MDQYEFYNQPFEFYCTASENGNSVAQACLGRNYIYGIGVKKNDRHGYYWISKSGDKFAMSLILWGLCSEYGMGVPRDLFNAINYYRRAKTFSSKIRLDLLFLNNPS